MPMPKFSRLVKCGLCNSNMKAKIERGKRKYICSNYDNYGNCKRIPVEEEYLMELLDRRYGRILAPLEIKEVVEHIEVFDKTKTKEVDMYNLKIYLKHDDPIIVGDKFWQF